MGLLRRIGAIVPDYLTIAWWGLVTPRTRERQPPLIVQAVVLDGDRVLLSVRSDLHGWELPGGELQPGEPAEAALCREISEETGFEVAVRRRVGDYVRTGFRPHTARIFLCRVVGGELRSSRETPLVRWFRLGRLPDTLFPWYCAPLADALADLPEPVVRHEHHGLAAIWAGMQIDLRMRLSDDRAGT